MNQIIFLPQPIDMTTGTKGPFYVIENFPFPQFVTNEEGELKSFDKYEDAAAEAADCQDGFIISFG